MEHALAFRSNEIDECVEPRTVGNKDLLGLCAAARCLVGDEAKIASETLDLGEHQGVVPTTAPMNSENVFRLLLDHEPPNGWPLTCGRACRLPRSGWRERAELAEARGRQVQRRVRRPQNQKEKTSGIGCE